MAQNNDATFHENKYSHGILETREDGPRFAHNFIGSTLRLFRCFLDIQKDVPQILVLIHALSLPRLKHSSHDPFDSSAWHPLYQLLGVKFCPFRWMADDVQRRDESIFSCIVISDIANIWLTLAEAKQWVEESYVA